MTSVLQKTPLKLTAAWVHIPSLELADKAQTFDEHAIARIIKVDHYENLVREVCRRAVQSPESTYILMERYAYINGFAASGVALLAGNIGYSRDLFRDKSTQPEGVSDRGMMIASKILAATIDEHSDRTLGQVSHRALAQTCVNAIASYARLSTAERSLLDRKPERFLQIVSKFKNNYQGEPDNAAVLMRSLGYHIASEYLADREYQIKDQEIWFKHPDDHFRKMVKRGRRKDGTWWGHWAWVTTHGHCGDAHDDDGRGVEHDHYLYAVEAFEATLKFKPHELTHDKIISLATEGIRMFRDDWIEFYKSVLEELEAHV